jgi:hypothetical protein
MQTSRLSRLTVAATCGIAACSFALSYASTTAIAEQAGMHPAPLLAACVDGLVAVSTLGTHVLSQHRSKIVRFYPWAILVLAGAAAVMSNGLHATGTDLASEALFVIGAFPPAALLLASHLAVVMLAPAKAVARRATPSQRPAEASSRPALAPLTVRGAAGTSRGAIVERLREELRSGGELPSADQLAVELQASPRTARRVLSEVRAVAN